MNSYYQLIFLGDTTCDVCRKVKERFFVLLNERGLDKSLIAVLDGDLTLTGREAGGYDSAKPTFAFYFGKQDNGDKDVDALMKLIRNRDAIYPVFFSVFEQEIPKVLQSINGVHYVETELDSIVNVAFEELRLLRKKRRVFISYKRSDSVAVANQLYDVLSRQQFDVFLDTYSIRGAADFQAELHHRITDSDVLIQLNSPKFMDSNWCREEISEANARQVGVLQLNWPNISAGAANQLCVVRRLDNVDFKYGHCKHCSSRLKKVVLEEIAAKVEALRARNIAAREDGLTAEFAKEAERQGRMIIKEPIFLVESRADGEMWYYIPAIGVPQSMDCYESLEMLKKWLKGAKMPDKVFLIYDDLRILPRWIPFGLDEPIFGGKNYKETGVYDMDTINNVKNIFLSASVPLEERDPKFFKTADVIAIRDAVIALASTVLANKEYHLIWGGHPSITPLITLVLERYGLKMSDRVTLYQSKEFEKFFLPENEDVGIRVITDKKENRDASLLLMRQKMIGDHKYEAAVFIGGMEGVLDEYAMFEEFHPGVPCLPIASTGAAALMLFEEHFGNFDKRLLTELSYTSLFKELLGV